MTKYVLEDNVPIPATGFGAHGGTRGSKYPVDEWTEGQSFRVPITGVARTLTKKDGSTVELTAAEDGERQARTRAANIYGVAKRRGTAITSRYLPDEGVIRFWHAGPFVAKAAKAEGEESEGEESEGEDFDL